MNWCKKQDPSGLHTLCWCHSPSLLMNFISNMANYIFFLEFNHLRVWERSQADTGQVLSVTSWNSCPSKRQFKTDPASHSSQGSRVFLASSAHTCISAPGFSLVWVGTFLMRIGADFYPDLWVQPHFWGAAEPLQVGPKVKILHSYPTASCARKFLFGPSVQWLN